MTHLQPSSVPLAPESRFTTLLLLSTVLYARGVPFSSVLNELNGRPAKTAALTQRASSPQTGEGDAEVGVRLGPKAFQQKQKGYAVERERRSQNTVWILYSSSSDV